MTVLDHLGVFVTDGDRAAAALRGLGFTVTPRSEQGATDPATGQRVPAGTGNVCVMFREGYLEAMFPTHDTEAGRTIVAEAEARAGVHLISLGVADAEGFDAARRADGWPMRDLARFGRDVAGPEGPMQARFTLARPGKGVFPEARVQAMTHHAPGALWQDRWLTHPNGARALRAVLVVSPDPAATAARFARFAGTALGQEAGHPVVDLARGRIECWTAAEARAAFGLTLTDDAAHPVGLRIEADRTGVTPFPADLGQGVFVFET